MVRHASFRKISSVFNSLDVTYYCLFYFSHVLVKEKKLTSLLKSDMYTNTFLFLIYLYGRMAHSKPD